MRPLDMQMISAVTNAHFLARALDTQLFRASVAGNIDGDDARAAERVALQNAALYFDKLAAAMRDLAAAQAKGAA